MSVIVKICGLSTPEALDVALEAGADMVGFVFFAPSPRHVAFETARALGSRVRGRAQKVALTVDADDTLIDAVVDTLKPDLLQLHGKESAERAIALKARFGLPVMKAIPVGTKADVRNVAVISRNFDRLLFDAVAPRQATRPGGLDAANVGEALRITRAPGVDVSSGVERAPGEKDPDKIRAFVRAARAAAAAVTSPA